MTQEKIDLLKEVISDVENQLSVRQISDSRNFAKTSSARNYYRGIEEGAFIALHVLHERIRKLNNDSNSN